MATFLLFFSDNVQSFIEPSRLVVVEDFEKLLRDYIVF